MLSALARSREGRALLDFAQDSKLNDCWSESGPSGVEVAINGRILDNQNGNEPIVNGKVNTELVLHLSSPDGGTAVVNLATILACATAFIASEFGKAAASHSKK